MARFVSFGCKAWVIISGCRAWLEARTTLNHRVHFPIPLLPPPSPKLQLLHHLATISFVIIEPNSNPGKLDQPQKQLVSTAQSIDKPPYFNGEHYVYWKNMMIFFIKGKDFYQWDIIEDGPFVPFTRFIL
ncbi:hypothetical protein GQ457_17G010230 [Hibiscus cannabinus]